MNRVAPFGVLVLIAVWGCSPLKTDVVGEDLVFSNFQARFMTTFDVYANNGEPTAASPRGGRALTPFEAGSDSRATVNPTGAAWPALVLQGSTVLTNYPEPNQTSAFTITAHGTNPPVYKVQVVTTFPAGDLRSQQVEEYYVRDITGPLNPSPSTDLTNAGEWNTTADGLWTTGDVLVDFSATNTWNPLFRTLNRLSFADGSYQNEKILKFATGTAGVPGVTGGSTNPQGLATLAYGVGGNSLEYPDLFLPKTDGNASFSSVVAYTRKYNDSPTYWFWAGNRAQTILGIRYYTEHYDTATSKLLGTMVVFEKAITQLETLDGDFADATSAVFLPALGGNTNPVLLAQSVMRQTVAYAYTMVNNSPVVNYASASRDTRMKTTVVNISDNQDIYIQRINEEATEILNGSTTLYIPNGDAAEVLVSDANALVDTKTSNEVANTSGGAPIVVVNENPVGDLGTLYSAINNPPSVSNTVGVPDEENLLGDKALASFNAKQGITLTAPTTGDYAFTSVDKKTGQGSVEAWIYVNAHTNSAGIVHFGGRSDFFDEFWSLQFMGATGQLAFSLSSQSGYAYDWVGSTFKLATKRWYHVAATWTFDRNTKKGNMKLFINGVQNASKNLTTTGFFKGTKIATELYTDIPVVVGSQFFNGTQVLDNYFGYNGKITGVWLQGTARDAAYFLGQYNKYKDQTGSW